MDRPVEARVTRHPAAVLLRSSALPALVAGGLVAVGFAFSSATAAASVGVGVGLALVALSAGPALLAVLPSVSPPAAMLMALTVYGTVVMALAVAYQRLYELSWLSGIAVGAGIGAATLAWLAGMIRAVPRLRIPIFGVDQGFPGEAGDPGPGGSSASSSDSLP